MKRIHHRIPGIALIAVAIALYVYVYTPLPESLPHPRYANAVRHEPNAWDAMPAIVVQLRQDVDADEYFVSRSTLSSATFAPLRVISAKSSLELLHRSANATPQQLPHALTSTLPATFTSPELLPLPDTAAYFKFSSPVYDPSLGKGMVFCWVQSPQGLRLYECQFRFPVATRQVEVTLKCL